MFKKMMVLCLAVVCMMSSLDVITAKAEQVCGAEEYQKIMNKTAELYGEAGVMEAIEDYTYSYPGEKKFRVVSKVKFDFKKGVFTGVAVHSTGKTINAKLSFNYSTKTNKIKYNEIIKKDVMALDYIKNDVYDVTGMDNAIDIISITISGLAADDSNIVEKTKNGFKGNVVNSSGTKTKFSINVSSDFKKIEVSVVNVNGNGVRKLKRVVKKIG